MHSWAHINGDSLSSCPQFDKMAENLVNCTQCQTKELAPKNEEIVKMISGLNILYSSKASTTLGICFCFSYFKVRGSTSILLLFCLSVFLPGLLQPVILFCCLVFFSFFSITSLLWGSLSLIICPEDVQMRIFLGQTLLEGQCWWQPDALFDSLILDLL